MCIRSSADKTAESPEQFLNFSSWICWPQYIGQLVVHQNSSMTFRGTHIFIFQISSVTSNELQTQNCTVVKACIAPTPVISPSCLGFSRTTLKQEEITGTTIYHCKHALWWKLPVLAASHWVNMGQTKQTNPSTHRDPWLLLFGLVTARQPRDAYMNHNRIIAVATH